MARLLRELELKWGWGTFVSRWCSMARAAGVTLPGTRRSSTASPICPSAWASIPGRQTPIRPHSELHLRSFPPRYVMALPHGHGQRACPPPTSSVSGAPLHALEQYNLNSTFRFHLGDLHLEVLDGVAHGHGQRAALDQERDDRVELLREVAAQALALGRRVVLDELRDAGEVGRLGVGGRLGGWEARVSNVTAPPSRAPPRPPQGLGGWEGLKGR